MFIVMLSEDHMDEDPAGVANSHSIPSPSAPSREPQIESVGENEDEHMSQIEGEGIHIRSPSGSANDGLAEVAEQGPPSENAELERGLSRVSTVSEVYSVFTKPQRILIVAIAAFAGFISPLSANIYFPALTTIAKDLDITVDMVNLTLTTYMIFQGIAPMFIAGLADSMGRRPAYIITFAIYLAANIGLALQNNYTALMILRCVQSSGSSGTVALTYASVADVSTSAERGTYLGLAGSGLMLGPTLGPVIGGLLSQFLGWHSIFWFLTILSLVMLLTIVVLLPETGRNVVGNGSIPPPIWGISLISFLQQRRLRRSAPEVVQEGQRKKEELTRLGKLRLPNPLKTLRIIGEKDVGLLLFCNSLAVVAVFCAIASLPTLLAQIYHFNDLQIGLAFIPFGVGSAVSSIANGRLLDWNFRRVAKQHGLNITTKRGSDLRGFPIEKARLQCALPMLYLGVVFLIIYGWLLDREVHYVGPLLLLFFIGLTLTGSFNIAMTYLVDLYPQSPATATAASNLVRCLMSAGATALINQMITAMGRGWCFTFVALVVALGSLQFWSLLKWGPQWREARYVRTEAAEAKKRASEAPAPGDELNRASTDDGAVIAEVEKGGQDTDGCEMKEEKRAEKGESSI